MRLEVAFLVASLTTLKLVTAPPLATGTFTAVVSRQHNAFRARRMAGGADQTRVGMIPVPGVNAGPTMNLRPLVFPPGVGTLTSLVRSGCRSCRDIQRRRHLE